MKIITNLKDQHLITDLSEWEGHFKSNKSKIDQWRKNRSAYSLADFMLNHGGRKHLEALSSSLLNEDTKFDLAIPEFKVAFDKHRNPREHDLGIFGQTVSGKKVFIGVEAKVDEPFGVTISAAKDLAIKELQKKPTSKRLNRIDGLLQRHYGDSEGFNPELRYQLFYATVGTLDAKWMDKSEIDHHLLLIIAFRTDEFDLRKGENNFKNYLDFVNSLPGNLVNTKSDYFEIADARHIYIENRELPLCYVYFDLP